MNTAYFPLDPTSLRIIAFVIGLCVGSFLNVLALRSLAGESVLSPSSRCPGCKHALGFLDNVPVLSFFMLKGQCRYCHRPISWQYPLVEAVTGFSFLGLIMIFGPTIQFLAMSVFVSTLIAVTITDFREKLIPHDITYPAMLVGLYYSSAYRGDLLGALAGVGVSYILFDFLAHYGLKLYMSTHAGPVDAACSHAATNMVDEQIDEALLIAAEETYGGQEEEMEVMGGGDAVLSAVIAAWLGWQKLVVALALAFIFGTVMGMFYLLGEMHKAGIIEEGMKPGLIGGLAGFLALGGSALAFASLAHLTYMPWFVFGCLGGIAGFMLGIITVGTRVSKPFPFGPALALGGVVAILWTPFGSL